MTDLEDLYREIILDHYRSPRNRGELESPPAQRVEGFNPLCGDEVVVTVLVEDGCVTDVRFAGNGCSISQSSASLMSSAVKGKSVDEVRELIRTFKSMMSIHEATLGPDDGDGDGDGGGDGHGDEDGDRPGSGSHAGAESNGLTDVRELGELAALQGVVKFPVRIKCATLSWNALAQGLDEVESG
ncbi:MAG: Fe-S cluster assembly sulfur transfer protein SufU [Acidimicrobiales bacterium]